LRAAHGYHSIHDIELALFFVLKLSYGVIKILWKVEYNNHECAESFHVTNQCFFLDLHQYQARQSSRKKMFMQDITPTNAFAWLDLHPRIS